MYYLLLTAKISLGEENINFLKVELKKYKFLKNIN